MLNMDTYILKSAVHFCFLYHFYIIYLNNTVAK